MDKTPKKIKKMPKGEFKVEGKHTYKYLPEWFLKIESNRELLTEAAHYEWITSIYTSNELFEYLKDKYHIRDHGNVEGGHTAIFNNTEIHLYILDSNLGKVIIIFTHPSNKGDINDQFREELNYKNQHHRIGLAKVLDPNYGGRITPDYIRMAEVMIYG